MSGEVIGKGLFVDSLLRQNQHLLYQMKLKTSAQNCSYS